MQRCARIKDCRRCYVARLIRDRLRGRACKPFRYVDKGSLAVIGRNAAVADLGVLKFSGFFAWFAWVFVGVVSMGLELCNAQTWCALDYGKGG